MKFLSYGLRLFSREYPTYIFVMCVTAIGILCGFKLQAAKEKAVLPERTSVRAVFDQMVSAAKKSDEKALAQFQAPSATYMDGSGYNRGYEAYYARVQEAGKAQAEAYQSAVPSSRQAPTLSVNAGHSSLTNFRVTDVTDRTVGDIAWITYRYALTAPMNGKPTPIIGLATIIFQRSGDTWKVVHSQTAGRPVRESDSKF
jgi:Domain of unknown function (DUF4440)